MSTAVAVAWLAAVWTALWGSVTPANVGGGVIAALVVVRLFPTSEPHRARWSVRPISTMQLAIWFTWKLIQANLVMLREVLTPTDYTRPGVVAVPIEACSPLIATIIANGVSLTPGTLTLDIKGSPPVLYVHVMHLGEPDEVRRSVRELEARVTAAFGSGGASALSVPRPKEPTA